MSSEPRKELVVLRRVIEPPSRPMRRRMLVGSTTLVLWAAGYLAYVISNTVRPTAPATPPGGQGATEAPGDDARDD